MEAASTSWRSLGDILVDRGLLSEQDLAQAVAEESATEGRLTEILVRRGLVSGHDITAALIEQMTRFGGQEAGSQPPLQAVPTTADDEAVVEEDAELDTEVARAAADADAAEEPSRGLSLLPLPDPLDAPDEPAAPAGFESESPDESTALDGIEAQSDQVEATQERARARKQALADEIAELQRTLESVEQTSSELDGLKADLAAKLDDLSDLRTTAAMWNSRVADVEGEIGSLLDRIDSTDRELAQLVDGSAPADS